MAAFTGLPPEIVEHIILCVYLGDQYTPPFLESFTIEESQESSPLIAIGSQCVAEYAKSKISTRSFTDGVLALHDCLGNGASFHMFLHRMFYKQRCRRNGLLALSLTSRRLYKLVQPLLWNLIELDTHHYWHDCPSEELVRHPNSRLLLSLMRQPDLGLSVKAFSFEYASYLLLGWQKLNVVRPRKDHISGDGYWSEMDSAKPELSHLLPEDSPDKHVSYWTSTSYLLACLPNLRSLKLLIAPSRKAWHFRCLSDFFLSQLAGLQSLTELSLVWQGTQSIDFDRLVKLFFLPALRALYLSGLIFDERYANHEEDPDVVPDVPMELRRKSEIRTLILDFMNVDAGPLIALLQLPVGLESFTHRYTSDKCIISKVSPGRVYDLLYSHRKTLRHLDLIEHRDVRIGRPFPGRCAEEILKDFRSLKLLGCPAQTLKSRRTISQDLWEEDLYQGRAIHEVLPASLEGFKLYVYDDWDMRYFGIEARTGGWFEDFETLFQRKTVQFPKLKNIWVEYWPQRETEARDDEQPSYLEQIMSWVQVLKSDAAKVGINLEVQMDTKTHTMTRMG